MKQALKKAKSAPRTPRYSVIAKEVERTKAMHRFWDSHNELPRIITPVVVGGEHNYQALKSHQDIRELAPGYACADAEPEGFTLRLALLQAINTCGGIVSLNAARWLYEGGTRPEQFEVYYPPYGKRPQGKLVIGRRKRVFQPDILVFSGLQVTSPARTQKDLGLDHEILAPVIR